MSCIVATNVYQNPKKYKGLLGTFETITYTAIGDESCDLVVRNIAGQYIEFIGVSMISVEHALNTKMYAEDVLILLSYLIDHSTVSLSDEMDLMDNVKDLEETAQKYKKEAESLRKSYGNICQVLNTDREKLRIRKEEIKEKYEKREKTISFFLKSLFDNSEQNNYNNINEAVIDLKRKLVELEEGVAGFSQFWMNAAAELRDIGEKYAKMKNDKNKNGKVNVFTLRATIQRWEKILENSRNFSEIVQLGLVGREYLINDL